MAQRILDVGFATAIGILAVLWLVNKFWGNGRHKKRRELCSALLPNADISEHGEAEARGSISRGLGSGQKATIRVNPQKHCIVLVHGTWSPKAAWTQAGSFFREELARRLGDSFEVLDFNWSGSNSQLGRRMASVRLAQWIRKERASYATIQLVGHSHGGNVATRAASLQAGKVASVVTLATPFIEVISEPDIPDDEDRARNPAGLIFGGIFAFALMTGENDSLPHLF